MVTPQSRPIQHDHHSGASPIARTDYEISATVTVELTQFDDLPDPAANAGHAEAAPGEVLVVQCRPGRFRYQSMSVAVEHVHRALSIRIARFTHRNLRVAITVDVVGHSLPAAGSSGRQGVSESCTNHNEGENNFSNEAGGAKSHPSSLRDSRWKHDRSTS